MTERQKADLYWKKRVRYIVSAKEKGCFSEGILNIDTAEEVLSCYNTRRDEPAFFPTGREFLGTPPSAAGAHFFADSAALLWHFCGRIERVVSMEEGELDDFIRKVFSGGMLKDRERIEQVLKDYLTASGIDETGAPVTDKAAVRAAKRSFLKSRERYEEMMRDRLAQVGSAVIDGLREEEGIAEKLSVQIPPEDEHFEEMIHENAKAALRYEDELDRFREAIEKARIFAAEDAVLRQRMFSLVFERFFHKTVSPVRRQIMTNVFFEYRHVVDRRVRTFLDIREACYYYARFLLTAEPVDAILHEKIAEHLGAECDVLDEEEAFASLPHFEVPSEPADGEELLLSLPALLEESESLKSILNSHPGVFDAQSLLSAAEVSGELGGIAHRARRLSVSIDAFTCSEEAKGMDRFEWFSLFDTWVIAENAAGISLSLMEFLAENRNRTVGEAALALRELLPDISYTLRERGCRKAIREQLIERSGHHVFG